MYARRFPVRYHQGTGNNPGLTESKPNMSTTPKGNSPKKPKTIPEEASAVVEGTPHRRVPADPIAELHREVLGNVDLNTIYRPAPGDDCPRQFPQTDWNSPQAVNAAGEVDWNRALPNIRLGMLAGMRIGNTYNLANRVHGSEEVSGIGGVNRVDRLEGGLLVGFKVDPKGDPAPIMGEDRVNIFELTRDLFLWSIAPKMKKGQTGTMIRLAAGEMYAAGIETLAPVNGKPRQAVLWVAKCAAFCAEETLAKLASIEASLTKQASVEAEPVEDVEVIDL